MARITVLLVIFLVAFNGGAAMMQEAGIDEMWDGNAEVGGDEAVAGIEKSADDPNTGTGAGETLFGLYNVLGNVLGGIFNVMPLFDMLIRAGVPQAVLTPFQSVIVVIMGVDIIAFVRGFNL